MQAESLLCKVAAGTCVKLDSFGASTARIDRSRMWKVIEAACAILFIFVCARGSNGAVGLQDALMSLLAIPSDNRHSSATDWSSTT
jgi:hypothetical protein